MEMRSKFNAKTDVHNYLSLSTKTPLSGATEDYKGTGIVFSISFRSRIR